MQRRRRRRQPNRDPRTRWKPTSTVQETDGYDSLLPFRSPHSKEGVVIADEKSRLFAEVVHGGIAEMMHSRRFDRAAQGHCAREFRIPGAVDTFPGQSDRCAQPWKTRFGSVMTTGIR